MLAARSEVHNNVRQQPHKDIVSLGQRMKGMTVECVWTEEKKEKICVVEIMIHLTTCYELRVKLPPL